MKRLVSNKRGEVSYGPKWQQHTDSSSDSENDYDDNGNESLHSQAIANQDQIPKGKRVEVTVKHGELMYEAALRGDWLAAEVLLEQDPNLAFEYVTEEGGRALHVAAAMKHKEFVNNLSERMSEENLALLDGDGNTACCYAALSGDVEIARLIIGDRPKLATVHDKENVTPLHKAALPGNERMLSFLLGYAKGEDLSTEEWFDLLLVTMRCKMFGVAVDVIGKNGSIAAMANKEGTALHLLARFEALAIPDFTALLIVFQLLIMVVRENGRESVDRASQDTFNERWPRLAKKQLAEKLWAEMLKMEKASLLELLRKPVHIVHEAAKTGQVDIITMLSLSFPQLIWETDSNGYTIFHMAIMYRQNAVFDLIREQWPMLGSRTTWQDRRGNNILHLAAAKSAAHVTQVKLPPVYQMQKELTLFQAVKKIVPPSCLMTRNRKGWMPEELFSKKHKKLLQESKLSMINRADSLMLIATILLTVVFAAGFAIPGGYSSQTGEPMLAKKKWFKAFVVFEVLSIMSSIVSIIMFQSIMASSFAEVEFRFFLPFLQKAGFIFLVVSLTGAFLAFMSSIMLFNINMTGLVCFGIIAVCGYGIYFWSYSEL